jgi:hypothetical protein
MITVCGFLVSSVAYFMMITVYFYISLFWSFHIIFLRPRKLISCIMVCVCRCPSKGHGFLRPSIGHGFRV